MEELNRFSEQIVKSLMLRQRYMKASLQEFYKPTAKMLSCVSDAGVCNIFDDEIQSQSDDNILLKKKSIAGKKWEHLLCLVFLVITSDNSVASWVHSIKRHPQ